MVNLEQDDHLISALTRIADALEDNTDILRGIKKHYDGVVPVMERNAKRVEKAHEEQGEGEFGWGDYLNPKKVFKQS